MEKSTHSRDYAALRVALRAARQEAQLSQRGLAARLRVPHSWVAKVETGERRVDLIEFCWFLRECGADPLQVTDDLIRRILKGSPRGGRSK